MRIAVVRDYYLNLWDAGNYAGVADCPGVELYLCGRGDDVPWRELALTYPKAKLFQYGEHYEVTELEPDIIDVPDAHYQFSQYYTARHDKVFIATWDNIPGKNSFSTAAKSALGEAYSFIARSQGARRALEWDGVPRSKIKVIPGAVDTEVFYPAPLEERANAILFVGRLVTEKGVTPLMWAMKEVPEPELWIVGDGPEKQVLRRWADLAGITKRTRFFGTLDRSDLAEVYRQARVFALPSLPKMDGNPYSSWSEQFGQVLIEALASGLPIIGTRSGAIPEVGGHVAGLYSDPLDWSKLAENIDKVLTDEKRWEKMSAGARKRAEYTYASEVVSAKLMAWYRNGRQA